MNDDLARTIEMGKLILEASERPRILNARAAIAEIDRKRERLEEVMLACGKGQIPATVIKRAKDLEAKKAHEQSALAAMERDIASNMEAIDQFWESLRCQRANREAAG